MLYARQSTAQIVTVGPVMDADGVAVTDSVVGDFKISKNGAAPAALNGSATLTHRHTGHYSLSLTATDLNTVGTAEVTCDDTVNACPVKEIQVVEPATYDVLFADAAPGPASPTNITAGTITTATNVTTVNGLAANVITAAATAADFGTEVGTAVWATATRSLTVLDEDSTTLDLDATIRAAVGMAAADLDTQIDTLATATALDAVDNFVDTEIAALTTAVADLPTNAELATALGTADDATLAAIAALDAKVDTVDNFLDTEIAAILAAVDTEVAAIKAQTDKLTFTVANQLDANVQSVNDVAIVGDGSVTPFNV